MKNLIISIAILFVATSTQAQDRYTQGMEQGFKLWKENKTTEASAIFQRIAQAEKDNWIPYYYATNVLVASSFTTKDKAKVNEMLEKSQELIAKAHEISPDNTELLTMEGLIYTGYVAMEPETYAMQYSSKIMGLHAQALELDDTNPRAHFNKIEYEIGTARFFQQDLTTFCEGLENTRALFENQESDVPFYPSYGLERLEATLTQCECPTKSK